MKIIYHRLRHELSLYHMHQINLRDATEFKRTCVYTPTRKKTGFSISICTFYRRLHQQQWRQQLNPSCNLIHEKSVKVNVQEKLFPLLVLFDFVCVFTTWARKIRLRYNAHWIIWYEEKARSWVCIARSFKVKRIPLDYSAKVRVFKLK